MKLNNERANCFGSGNYSSRRIKYLLLILLSAFISKAQAQKTLDTNGDDLKIPKLVFDSNGELKITASSTSSPNDFDFFVGKWKIHNRRLKTRLNNCTEWTEFDATVEMHKIFSNSVGNTDYALLDAFDGKPSYEGFTIRLFNPKTKLWSIYWAASNTGTMELPNVGSFKDGVGDFFTKDTYNGKKIIALLRWDVRDKNNFKWSQAFSADNGKTWEWNWYMTYEKL
jgi:hypothetical protein